MEAHAGVLQSTASPLLSGPCPAPQGEHSYAMQPLLPGQQPDLVALSPLAQDVSVPWTSHGFLGTLVCVLGGT